MNPGLLPAKIVNITSTKLTMVRSAETPAMGYILTGPVIEYLLVRRKRSKVLKKMKEYEKKEPKGMRVATTVRLKIYGLMLR